jgi:AbrB family looped-hinge helix DNA binding protein
MKINSKGQVTIPKAVRQRAGLHPHCEIEFEVRPNGDVILRPLARSASSLRASLERVRGSANASEFKGMSTDAYLSFLRR